jgi:hypothetical protein
MEVKSLHMRAGIRAELGSMIESAVRTRCQSVSLNKYRTGDQSGELLTVLRRGRQRLCSGGSELRRV